MTTSAALFRASNLSVMDYPFAAALASALRICDEAVIVMGQSEDDTRSWVHELAQQYAGRVYVHSTRFVFDRKWQQEWWQLASSLTDAEWLLWLDADEVIQPDQVREIKQLMAQPDVRLIRFPFVHLYGTPRWHVAKGFLTHNTRLGRRSAGYRMVNLRHDRNPGASACAMMVRENGQDLDAHSPMRRGSVTVDTSIMHYGWCRHAQALAISQAKHYAWYANGDGLEDGHIPTVQPYDFEMEEEANVGKIVPYRGSHAPDLQGWFEQHQKAWRTLETVVP